MKFRETLTLYYSKGPRINLYTDMSCIHNWIIDENNANKKSFVEQIN